jgi:RNA polymerase subunit RPABC4/transcription elongation factor Spt4
MSPDLMNTIGVVLQIVLALAGAFFFAFWISLVIWAFRDIRARTRDVFAQILAALLVLLFTPFLGAGLVLYLLLRPKETLAEAYERALEEEALLRDIEEQPACPRCQRHVEAEWQVCPYCREPLKTPCPHCGKLIALNWTICPYCAQEPSPRPRRLEETLTMEVVGLAESRK